jgi:hypothetical protein
VDYNIGSPRAFLKNGYRLEDGIELPEESKADYELDVVVSREEYFGGRVVRHPALNALP